MTITKWNSKIQIGFRYKEVCFIMDDNAKIRPEDVEAFAVKDKEIPLEELIAEIRY